MTGVLSTAAICFIACHGGPADHFSTFAEELQKRGYQVEVYATGPALQKFQDKFQGRDVVHLHSFSLEPGQELKSVAEEIAEKCQGAQVVITDVGHKLDVDLQNTLKNRVRLAYYDNPESYVPGGYSSVAAKVMQAAHGVLFANGNLCRETLYEEPSKEIALAPEKRKPIGYYAVTQAETIAKRRTEEKEKLRGQLFAAEALPDQGQKILVYAGGNNETYFEEALPALLEHIEKASQTGSLSNVVVVLQQHPGAAKENRDVARIHEWVKNHKQEGYPSLLISKMNSENAQVVADAMLYYQTSMGPQFILAGIPTLQVGHDTYEDILVKNKLCSSATTSSQFVEALSQLWKKAEDSSQQLGSREKVYQGLGISPDWAGQLEKAISEVQTQTAR